MAERGEEMIASASSSNPIPVGGVSSSSDDLLDDSEETLRRMCGDRIYGVLQSDGFTASKLWAHPNSVSELYSSIIKADGVAHVEAVDLACRINAKMSLVSRYPFLLSRVGGMKTRDSQLEEWLMERLKHRPEDGVLQGLLHSLKAKPAKKRGHQEEQMAMDSLKRSYVGKAHERMYDELCSRSLEAVKIISRGEEENRRAMASLKRRYVGKAHESMYDELCRLCLEATSDRHYSCYTTIVQSSGTGKTRGVLEMSRLGVYICYCSTAAPDGFACPPRTGELAEELSRTGNELAMALYFKAWLSVLVDEAIGKKMSPVEWMDSQLEDACPIRAAVLRRWKEYRGRSLEGVVLNEDADNRNLTLLEPELKELKRLPTARGNLKILLVFDEARGLLFPGNLEDGGLVQDISAFIDSPFCQMRRVSRAFFSHRHCFSVAVDTEATMSNIRPDSSEAQSRKVKAVGKQLLRPVYQVFNMQLVTPTFDLSPSKVFLIGRPLWMSRIESGESMGDFIGFVERKLLGVRQGFLRGEQVDVHGAGGRVLMAESQAMALLSVTVGLEICPRSDLSRFLVASHTGVVTFISPDGERVDVSHPVEPAVSEAATRILNYSGGKPFVAALEKLNHAFLSGYCGRGDHGEVACKTLLLMAGWRLFQQGGFYFKRILVRDYLVSLLGLSKDEVNSACKGLPEDSCVFFNSFMLVNEKGKVTAEILEAAFLRGCAIHFRAGTHVRAFDFVIPVLTSMGMTFILVSGKSVQDGGNMRKPATEVLNPRNAIVSRTIGVKVLKVLTILINVSEPDPRTPLPASMFWKPNQLSKSYREKFDPKQVAHMSLYGLERNFRGLELNSDGRVKEEDELTDEEKDARRLLLDLLVSAPDTEKEAGLVSARAAEDVRKLVPGLEALDDAELRKLIEMAGAQQRGWTCPTKE